MSLFKYYLVLLYISFGSICSLFLFSRGFLLSRNIIKLKSVCSSNSNKSDRDVLNDSRDAYQDCLSYDVRVILVVIDALRYDFMASYGTDSVKKYHNKFKYVQRLLLNKDRTRLMRFIADPPTTTMQRLHGMMTGSLPTFIDIGSNFDSSEIIEDNLLSQLNNNNKKVVFLGDDTWMNLFPNEFLRAYPYPSFDVWDLETVDAGVSRSIYSEINKPDWNLLIAHYLGVDHCGHRYGPNHPEMERKLIEMDHVIENIVNTMDNNTILFVIGDHGMTENGDHGGDSEDEITAAVFVFSSFNFNNASSTHSINQIDLLPTISTLLGIPIPFSNLGSVVNEFLPKFMTDQQKDCTIFKSNINQITKYIKVYQSINGHFESSLYEDIIDKYNKLISLRCDNNNFTSEAKLYLKLVQNMCKTVWTQFDFISISFGLLFFAIYLLLFLSIYLHLYTFILINVKRLIFFLLIEILLVFIISFSSVSSTVFYWYLCGCICPFTLVFSSLSFRAGSVYELRSVFTPLTSTCFALFLFSILGVFSNSFIITENLVVTYLFNTFIIITYLQIIMVERLVVDKIYVFSLRIKSVITAVTVSLCTIARILSNFWQCYDSQSVECVSSKSLTLEHSLFSVLIILFFYIFINCFLCKFGFNFTKFYVTGIILTIFSCIFRLNNLFVSEYLVWILNGLPQVICFFSLIILVYFYIKPPLIVDDCFTDKTDIFQYSNYYWKYYLVVFIQFAQILWIFSLSILNDRNVLSSVTLFTSIFLLLVLLGVSTMLRSKEVFSISYWDITTWYMSQYIHFYGTGHQPTFPSLQWDAVGPFTHLHLVIPGCLILVNTFLSQIIHSLFLPLVVIVPAALSKQNFHTFSFDNTKTSFVNQHFRHSIFSVIICYMLLLGCRTFCTMLSATIHSRHLMVWKIFAPKFIFESVGYVVSIVFLFIGFVFVDRIYLYIVKNHSVNFQIKIR